jgi:hypothetical protein
MDTTVWNGLKFKVMEGHKDYNAIIANARLAGVPEDVIADLEEERMLSQDPSYVTWDELHELEDDGLNGKMPKWIESTINGREFRVCASLFRRRSHYKKKLLKKVNGLDGVSAFLEFTSQLLSQCVREVVGNRLVPLSPKELNPMHNKDMSDIHANLLRTLIRDFFHLHPAWNLDDLKYSILDRAFLDQLIDATGIFESFAEEDVSHIAELELIALLKQFTQRLATLILEVEEPKPDYTLEPDIKALAPPLVINPQIQPNSPNFAA